MIAAQIAPQFTLDPRALLLIGASLIVIGVALFLLARRR